MCRCSRVAVFSCCLLVVTGFMPALSAAPPSVEKVSPAAAQRGTSFALTLTGSGLQKAEEALIYSPNIRCDRLEALSDTQLVVHLTAADDCASGMHAIRIRSSEGISELQVFRISSLPVVAEAESNNTPEEAQGVLNNTTIVGTIEAGDVDCFQIPLIKGQRLSAEAEAMRAGGSMLDTVVGILGPDGNWLATVDDTPLSGQDPYVSVVAPADGDYIVQIHEASFEGDDNSRYALHIGSFPAPTRVFPPGGPIDQPVDVVFHGDAIGPIAQSLRLSGSGNRTVMVHAEQDGIAAPGGLPFRSTHFGNVIESEPNDTSSAVTLTATSFPIALNGHLGTPNDVDCFRVRAEKGQTANIEVYASRLGSPVDTLLEVMDERGRVISSSDDGVTHDSHVVVKFPESGEYIVKLTDKRGSGSDAHFYRIEVTEFQPQLQAFLSRPNRMSQDRQAIAVPQGNRVVTFLACQRQGFRGDVFLSASGLPEGLSMPTTEIPADRYWVPIVMEATDSAPIAGALVNVEASSQSAGGSVIGGFHQVVDLVAASADQLFQSAEVSQLAVAVTEPVPYAISLRQPATGLSADSTLDLMISVTRSQGFTGTVEISLPFLPPWVDGPDKVVIPSELTSCMYTLRAGSKVLPRDWQICAEARPGLASEKGGDENAMSSGRDRRSSRRPVARIAVASNLVSLPIAKSPVTGEIGTVLAEQGKPSQLKCFLIVADQLPESMTAVLEGLPNRVTAEPVTVKTGDSSVVFELKPDPTAPTGTFSDLMVRLDGVVNGEKVSWRIGRGSSLTIEPAGMLFTDESGRPLSQLDVLRRNAQLKNNPIVPF